MYSFRFACFLSMIFSFCVIGSGCKAGREPRKTLPDANLANGNPGLSTLPFYAVDTFVAGKKFTAIYLQNPDFDSLAFQLVHSYEPYAGSLLTMIAGQKVQGIIVDFRGHPDIQAGYTNLSVADATLRTKGQNDPALDILFLWDEVSSDRANSFINEIRNSPFLSVAETSSRQLQGAQYKQDCFSPVSPDFSNR